MKRSEMLEIIAEFIYDRSEYSMRLAREDAEVLLTLIEKQGMLPPNYCIKTENTELGYTTGVMSYYIDGNANWEKE